MADPKQGGEDGRRAPTLVSVVIPTLNEADNITACIRSVRDQRNGFEVIVVDGGSADGTPLLVGPRASVLASPPGRAVQMNAGAYRARGDALLFLHADSRLHPGALAALRRALADPEVVGGTFTLRFDDDALPLRLYAACTRFRCRYFHFGDAGIFVRRSVFEHLGGFREVPLMEDVEFLGRLRRAGRTALLPLPVTTSARRFRHRGLVWQQLLNAALVLAYSLGASPGWLVERYDNARPRPACAARPGLASGPGPSECLIRRARSVMNRSNLPTRVAQGASSGLLATIALYGLRTASQKWLPGSVPPIREDPGKFMMERVETYLPREVRERIPDAVESAASKGLAMGYGVTAGAVYGALRPAGRDPVADGTVLGLMVWAAGYLGWLPALGLTPPVTRQKAGEVIGPVVRHALWGISAVAAYRWIGRWAR